MRWTVNCYHQFKGKVLSTRNKCLVDKLTAAAWNSVALSCILGLGFLVGWYHIIPGFFSLFVVQQAFKTLFHRLASSLAMWATSWSPTPSPLSMGLQVRVFYTHINAMGIDSIVTFQPKACYPKFKDSVHDQHKTNPFPKSIIHICKLTYSNFGHIEYLPRCLHSFLRFQWCREKKNLWKSFPQNQIFNVVDNSNKKSTGR